MRHYSIYVIESPSKSHRPYVGCTRQPLGHRLSDHRRNCKTGRCSQWLAPDSTIREVDSAQTQAYADWIEWWHVWFLGLENTENLTPPGTNGPKTRAKISAANTGEKNPWFGKTLSAEHRAKVSAALKGEKHPRFGKTHSAEARARMSAAAKKGEKHHNWGKTISAEHRAKISAALKGKPKPRITCPHCGKTASPGNYTRWHGDNCKVRQ